MRGDGGYSRDAGRTPHLRFRSVRSGQSSTFAAPARLGPTSVSKKIRDC